MILLVNRLRTRLAAPARALLDLALAGSLVALLATERLTPWLQLAYIAVAARAYVRIDGRSTIARGTVVTVIGTGVIVHLSWSGGLAAHDLLRVPMLAVLTCLFAGYASWRNRAERLVARDRERLARLIDALPLATIAFDGDARVVTWNRTAESLFGWKAEDVFGKPNPIVPPDEKPGSDELHGRILRGEMLKDVEVRRRAADGSVLELSVFTSLLDGELGPEGGFLVVYDDITERKGAERARDEAQDSYRDLIEALPLVSYVDRIDGAATTNVYTSPQIVELLGWDLAAWTEDRHFFEELLHADDFERVMGGTVDANGGAHAHEYRLRHANGDDVWVRDQSTVVENDDGTFVRGFLVDITKQTQLEEQLLQTQKMDALGQFAGGIAHDFNNLLTAISGYAELASATAHADGAQTRWLEGIKTAAAEAASLTSQLLSFTRHNVIERGLVDLNDVAHAAAGLLDRLVREDVVVQLELAERLPPVLGDLTQLKQVVLNLALNARDAMVEGGMLTIQTAAVGDSVILRVRDTGCGMSDVVKSRAFEPFFTTKPEGAGTGLGLAVAYGVVDALGGRLSISSRLGHGTTVEAILPAAAGDAAVAVVDAPVEELPAPGGGERVLVVEDRDVVRDLTRDVLLAVGFDVEAAAGGHEALEIAEGGAPFDLLLTDVVMPGLSGPELSALLRNRIAGLRVLYMSGYTDDVLDPTELADPSTGFLRKPFANTELVAKVRELLDAAPSEAASVAAA
jgi:two-component system cell cycle sensor histidine kinase/response regulator CckA